MDCDNCSGLDSLNKATMLISPCFRVLVVCVGSVMEVIPGTEEG